MPSNSILDEIVDSSETNCIAMGDENCAFVAEAKQQVKEHSNILKGKSIFTVDDEPDALRPAPLGSLVHENKEYGK